MTDKEIIDGLYEIKNWKCNGDSKMHSIIRGAIDLLEQQPFINKPCISEGVCREDKMQTLDKIRAEIEEAIYEETVVEPGSENERIISKVDPYDVLEIIDKYRTESEVNTDEDSN